MKNKGCAKSWGANKVHYGRCASGVFSKARRLLPCRPPVFTSQRKVWSPLKSQGKYWKCSVNYKVMCMYQWGEVYVIKTWRFLGEVTDWYQMSFDQENCNSAPSWWLHQQQTWVDCLSTTNLELLTKNRASRVGRSWSSSCHAVEHNNKLR